MIGQNRPARRREAVWFGSFVRPLGCSLFGLL